MLIVISPAKALDFTRPDGAAPMTTPQMADDIAELELASTTTIDLAVDRHEAVNDRLFHVSAGVKEPSELHELAKANALAADGNIVDWRWLCHL